MPLPASAQRIQDLLAVRGYRHRVVEMPDTTRTAEEAAAACGCTVAQIGKSVLFRTKQTGRPVLVVASGPNRVDEKKVGRILEEKIARADADFVREATGFAIGGVPPIGHAREPVTLIDRDLMDLSEIWCAAGTPRAVFRLTPDDLVAMTGGAVHDLRKD